MVKILSKTAIATPNNESVEVGEGPFGLASQLYKQAATALPNTANATTNDMDYANYTDRIFSDQQVGQNPNVLSLDPGANVLTTDQRYLNDAYNYFLGGGTGVPPTTEAGSTVQGPGTAAQGTGDGGNIPIGVMPQLDSQFEQQVMDPSQMMGQLGGLEYQGTPGGDVGSGEFGLIDSSGKDFGPYTQSDYLDAFNQDSPVRGDMDLEALARAGLANDPRYESEIAPTTVDGVTMQGRQNVTGDITDYLDPMQLDLTGTNAAAIPAGLTAAQVAKNAAGNWLYKGAAPGTRAATQAAAKGATLGQIGKQVVAEGGYGFGSNNKGFDKMYKGAGATKNPLTYTAQGLKSFVPGATAAGNIGGGTPAGRLAFEKALQSGVGRGIAGAARIAGLTTPIGAAATAATLTPMAIDALTRREPDATETSLFGMDLQGLEDKAAAYDGVDLDGFADPMSAGADYMPEEETPVTGITGPAGMEPDFYAENESAIRSGMGPNMADVAGPVQNITLPSGDVYAADDPQLLEKVDPETRSNTNMIAGLWEKAKGSATDFKNSLQDAGNFSAAQIASLVNTLFGNASTMSLAGAAGIPGMILGALAGAGTQVSPEQKIANAAFEKKHNINIGSDGRITSGPLAGLNPAGKSFAGSATYEEQIDNKIGYFEKRIEEGKSYSKEKYQDIKDLKAQNEGTFAPTDYEGEAYGTPDTIESIRDDAIDAGIDAADEEPGPGRDDPTPTGPATVEDTAAMEDIDFDEPSTFTPTTITPHTPTTTSFNPAQGGSGGDPSPPSPKGSQDMSQGQTGMGSCFIAGTKVRMADGTDKNIEDVIVGDTVKGQKGNNKVVALDPTLLGDRKLYSFNDNEHYFFTSEHPFMTEEGWKSIKPEKTKERDGVELYDQLKGELKVGDKLITDSGVTNITEIKSKEMNDPKMPLYNFHISNDNSYIADDYVVHNKGGGCFVKGTPITMADGSTKPVEQVDLGDKIAEGGKVFAAGRFLTEELHDYEGIKVSGSHMVNEDDTWVRVRDSKKGKPLGDDEHTVYVFGAENRRILINGILFTDYFEVKEQDQLATIGNKYFDQWGVYAKNDDINNVNTLNAS